MFTWSASGTIVTEALASTCPTVVVYVMDTVRSVSPVTFMSNMLYACSILYKTRLPFIVVMNKVRKCFFFVNFPLFFLSKRVIEVREVVISREILVKLMGGPKEVEKRLER